LTYTYFWSAFIFSKHSSLVCIDFWHVLSAGLRRDLIFSIVSRVFPFDFVLAGAVLRDRVRHTQLRRNVRVGGDGEQIQQRGGRLLRALHRLRGMCTSQWRNQPKNLGGVKIFGGTKMLGFRRITLFCLEKRLSRHKKLYFPEIFWGHGPSGSPCLRLWYEAPWVEQSATFQSGGNILKHDDVVVELPKKSSKRAFVRRDRAHKSNQFA